MNGKTASKHNIKSPRAIAEGFLQISTNVSKSLDYISKARRMRARMRQGAPFHYDKES